MKGNTVDTIASIIFGIIGGFLLFTYPMFNGKNLEGEKCVEYSWYEHDILGTIQLVDKTAKDDIWTVLNENGRYQFVRCQELTPLMEK